MLYVHLNVNRNHLAQLGRSSGSRPWPGRFAKNPLVLSHFQGERVCMLTQPEGTVFIYLQVETKPGGFLREKCSTVPLNSTGYTVLTPIEFFSAYCFKNKYLQVREV